jgi:hypothetical protein
MEAENDRQVQACYRVQPGASVSSLSGPTFELRDQCLLNGLMRDE